MNCLFEARVLWMRRLSLHVYVEQKPLAPLHGFCSAHSAGCLSGIGGDVMIIAPVSIHRRSPQIVADPCRLARPNVRFLQHAGRLPSVCKPILAVLYG